LLTARRAAIAAPAALMLGLGLWGLRRGSMYSGEAATHWAAQLSLGRLFHLLSHVDAVHGLYYLVIHAWQVLGPGEGLMRVPSVLGMAGAVAATAATGIRLSGSRGVGLLAGVLMALTPTISEYAQDARSYALVMCAVASAGLALLRALEPGSRWPRWTLYGALITLAGYLNELSLLVLLAHGAAVLVARLPARDRLRWLVSGGGGATLVLPLVVISSHETQAVSWIRPPQASAVGGLFHDYFGSSTVVAAVLALCALAACVPGRSAIAALSAAGPRDAWRTRPPMSAAAFALPLLVVPPAVLLVESVLARPLYSDRYVLFCQPAAALLAAAGIARLGRGLRRLAARVRSDSGSWAVSSALGWLPAGLACALVLGAQLSTQSYLRTPQSRPQDYAAAARFVHAQTEHGDAVVFLSVNYRNIELGYPPAFAALADPVLAQTPARSGTFRGIARPFPEIGHAMVRHPRIWSLGVPPGSRLTGLALKMQHLLERHFRLVSTRRFHGISVTLYARDRGSRGSS
jgi:mannosyltransferase